MKIGMSKKKQVLYKHDPIVIYCPKCDEAFADTDSPQWYCPKCKRHYSNDEVRSGSGL